MIRSFINLNRIRHFQVLQLITHSFEHILQLIKSNLTPLALFQRLCHHFLLLFLVQHRQALRFELQLLLDVDNRLLFIGTSITLLLKHAVKVHLLVISRFLAPLGCFVAFASEVDFQKLLLVLVVRMEIVQVDEVVVWGRAGSQLRLLGLGDVFWGGFFILFAT